MALKDWKKVKGKIRWIRRDDFYEFPHNTIKVFRGYKNKDEGVVSISGYNWEWFKTYAAALRYAKNYMRKN